MLRHKGGARCTPDWSWLKGWGAVSFLLVSLCCSCDFQFFKFVSTIICVHKKERTANLSY